MRPPQLYKQGILDLLPLLKNEAVALVDAIAPTDFIMKSPLGMSDGEMYHHLHASLLNNPATFERVSWWKDVIYWRDYATTAVSSSPIIKGKL